MNDRVGFKEPPTNNFDLVEDAISKIIDDDTEDGYVDPQFFVYAMEFLQVNPGASIKDALDYADRKWNKLE